DSPKEICLKIPVSVSNRLRPPPSVPTYTRLVPASTKEVTTEALRPAGSNRLLCLRLKNARFLSYLFTPPRNVATQKTPCLSMNIDFTDLPIRLTRLLPSCSTLEISPVEGFRIFNPFSVPIQILPLRSEAMVYTMLLLREFLSIAE